MWMTAIGLLGGVIYALGVPVVFAIVFSNWPWPRVALCVSLCVSAVWTMMLLPGLTQNPDNTLKWALLGLIPLNGLMAHRAWRAVSAAK